MAATHRLSALSVALVSALASGPLLESVMANNSTQDPDPTRRSGPPLAGVHEGPATTFAHPRGWFTFELPEGWTVVNQAGDSLRINPGLAPTDKLDALVVVSYGELDAAQAGRDVAELFEEQRPLVLQDLASQEIEVSNPEARPRVVTLARATGLVQEWNGKAGGRDVAVWLGGLAKEGHYLTVIAVVVAGQETRVLPGVKRILHSVDPRPPKRDLSAEQALAGASFSAIETRPGGSRGSFSTIFDFATGNRVKKTLIMSGMVGLSGVGGESEQWGTYEVVGDEVSMTFSDGGDALTLQIEGGRIVSLLRDGRTYRRR
jgi:hypothetical protein